MFDGSIKIDTRIDTKGFNKGTQSMTKSLGGVLTAALRIGKVIAALFIGGSIINGFRSITQSFDIMGSAVGEKIKPLTDALAVLKGTFVNLIVQAFIPFIPYLVTAVEWFTRLLSTVTQVVAALFGYKQTVGNIMTKVASDAKKAAKEVKGALAAFDQINVLQKQEQAVTGDTGPASSPAPITISQDLLDKIEKFKQKVFEFLKPAIELFEKLKLKFQETFGAITDWIRENPEKFKLLVLILGGLALAFLALIAIVLIASGVIGIATAVFGAFATVILFLASPFGLILLAILLVIGAIVLTIVWVRLLAILMVKTFQNIQEAWAPAAAWFRATVLEPLKEKFGLALDWIKEKFQTVFTSIKEFVRGVINDILGFINRMIEGILAGITLLTGLSAGNMSAGVAGSTARIPHLAKGAVIPPNARFAAILGDQRSGKNIEAPAALFEEMLNRAVAGAQGGEIVIHNTLTLDGEKVYQNQKRVSTRHGRSLIRGQ